MKRLKITLLLVMAFPGIMLANNSMAQATGISDGTLLALMIGFIVLLLAIIKALSKSIEGISRSSNLSGERKSEPSVKLIATLLLSGGSLAANAAENTPGIPDFTMSNELFWLLTGLIVFLAIVIAILFRSLMVLIRLERGDLASEEEESKDLFETLKLTDNVPLEEEESVMMDHEYDGIRELDNNLPPWWKYMFYATIIFSFVYIIRYHITGSGQLQGQEYAAQMEAAMEAKAEMMANAAESISEESVVLLVDAPSIEKGAAIYKGNCATCHGQLGEGGAGPNLTDEYWLHGGGIKNVFSTIKYGVPAKGMIAWQSQFSPSQIQKVASYVLSLQGTNPPNGKDPQGEKYVEVEEEVIPEETDTTATAEVTM